MTITDVSCVVNVNDKIPTSILSVKIRIPISLTYSQNFGAQFHSRADYINSR